MARGRKPNIDRPREWKLSIPSSVATEIDIFCLDVISGVPKKGLRSKITTELYRALLTANAKGEKTVDLSGALALLHS